MAESDRLPRRQREKLRQRQELLEAASSLFSQKGYNNVTMHEIAKRAEFAIGTLYKFFGSKEELYRGLVLDLCQKFEGALLKAMEEATDEVEKLRRFVRIKGEVFRANAALIRLYYAQTHGASFDLKAGLDAELRKRHAAFLRVLESIFERGIQKKRFKRIADSFSLAVALDSVTSAMLFLWLNDPTSHRYPEDPDEILDIFFKGLLHPTPIRRVRT